MMDPAAQRPAPPTRPAETAQSRTTSNRERTPTRVTGTTATRRRTRRSSGCGWRLLARWRRRAARARRVLHAAGGIPRSARTRRRQRRRGAGMCGATPAALDGDWRVADCPDCPRPEPFDRPRQGHARRLLRPGRQTSGAARTVCPVCVPRFTPKALCSPASRRRGWDLNRAPWASHTVDTPGTSEPGRPPCVAEAARRRFRSGGPGGARLCAHRHVRTRAVVAAEDFEPTAGAAQCNYELLKSFTGRGGPRLALGADAWARYGLSRPGSCPGSTTSTHMPARVAAPRSCYKMRAGPRDAACGALLWRASSTGGDECCGFGQGLPRDVDRASSSTSWCWRRPTPPGRTASGSAGRRGRRFPGSLRHFHMKRARSTTS